MGLERVVTPRELERALEAGQPILAYVRGGRVAWWAALEERATGDVEIRLEEGGLRNANFSSSRDLRGDGLGRLEA